MSLDRGTAEVPHVSTPFPADGTRLEIFRWYTTLGVSVIPIRADGKKAPALPAKSEKHPGWRKYSNEIPGDKTISEWSKGKRPVGIGVPCGPASGHLAVIDFDCSADGKSPYNEWLAKLPVWAADHIKTCPVISTPSGGKHIWLRLTDSFPGSNEVARYPDGKPKIEVRGEGQYVLAPGCPPECHELGKSYTFDHLGWLAPGAEQAGPSEEAVNEWFIQAFACTEYVEPERESYPEMPGGSAPSAPDHMPGSDFNHRGTWAETGLFDHGYTWWRKLGNDRGFITRPGKEGGVSASIGMTHSRTDGKPFFYCFSSSTNLPANRPIDKFGVYARLKHGGDFTAAKQALEKMGYGKPKEEPDVDISGITDGLGIGVNGTSEQQPDNSCDFATNEDLKKLNLGLSWVWDGWLQKGVVNLVAAQAGAGKTRFMADLCRRVHCGESWPDGQLTPAWDEQYLAMWVAGDRNHAELLTLSEAFGFGDRICYSGSKKDPTGGVTLNERQEFARLKKQLEAAKPLFLVVDTAGGTTEHDLLDQKQTRKFFAPLSDIATSLNLCVIVITHLSANATTLGRRAEERARCVIRISSENVQPQTKRRVEVIKSNSMFPDGPLGMILGTDSCGYDNEPPASPEERNGSAFAGQPPVDLSGLKMPSPKSEVCGKDKVLQVLREYGEGEVDSFVERTGEARVSIYKWLEKFVSEGKATKSEGMTTGQGGRKPKLYRYVPQVEDHTWTVLETAGDRWLTYADLNKAVTELRGGEPVAAIKISECLNKWFGQDKNVERRGEGKKDSPYEFRLTTQVSKVRCSPQG